MKRSNELREAHQLNAKRLLDLGFRKADVASTLQRKYHLSRATAYRDVDEADQSRELEDLTIEAEPVPMISMEDRDALMRMTRQMLIDAFESGNVQDYARLFVNTKGSPVWAACLTSLETFVSHHQTNEQLNQSLSLIHI